MVNFKPLLLRLFSYLNKVEMRCMTNCKRFLPTGRNDRLSPQTRTDEWRCKRFLPTGRNDRLSPQTRTDEWRRQACFKRSEKNLIAAAIHPFPLSIPVMRVIPTGREESYSICPLYSHFTIHNSQLKINR